MAEFAIDQKTISDLFDIATKASPAITKPVVNQAMQGMERQKGQR